MGFPTQAKTIVENQEQIPLALAYLIHCQIFHFCFCSSVYDNYILSSLLIAGGLRHAQMLCSPPKLLPSQLMALIIDVQVSKELSWPVITAGIG